MARESVSTCSNHFRAKEGGSTVRAVPAVGSPKLERQYARCHHRVVPVDVLIVPPLLLQGQEALDEGFFLLETTRHGVSATVHDPTLIALPHSYPHSSFNAR